MATQLADLMLNDRGFVFDPATGETFQLSTTGLRIIRLVQGGCAREDLLVKLTEEFDVDENTARRDIDDFLEAVEALGWNV